MIIQPGYNVLTYNDIQSSVGGKQSGNVLPATGASVEKYADQVTISSAGKTFVENASTLNEIPPRTEAQQRLINEGNLDSSFADEMSNMMVNSVTTMFVSLESIRENLNGPHRLATSGRLVTQDFEAAFNRDAAIFKTARKELYDSEKSKGTEPSKILEILIDFTNKNASPVYKEATGEGWFG
ncbi:MULTISPECIES: hypothetical protein [Marinobacterium]|uniref:Uncharacterized protein n=1 Tax=Marinobacterium iners DSM 11526 TaxID=1122198 RepID=A0A1H4H5W2_9GAMM|nr:hypothetical protein [Marinobacterium iners]SEB16800.1 hypothetical protein SAMN02745729_1282 [Marinobacterium iners DSM 11526]